jgi:hypothetical protein
MERVRPKDVEITEGSRIVFQQNGSPMLAGKSQGRGARRRNKELLLVHDDSEKAVARSGVVRELPWAEEETSAAAWIS